MPSSSGTFHLDQMTQTYAERRFHANASEAILSQNYADELLFQFGEALFDKQL
jgi:hypothetical protein